MDSAWKMRLAELVVGFACQWQWHCEQRRNMDKSSGGY